MFFHLRVRGAPQAAFRGPEDPSEEIPLFKHAIPLVRAAVNAVIDDSFNRCFEDRPPERWNWSYLFIPYYIGVLFRYCFLFPLRLAILVGGVLLLLVLFFFVKARRAASLLPCVTRCGSRVFVFVSLCFAYVLDVCICAICVRGSACASAR